MQEIGRSNSSVVTEICDTNDSRARHYCSSIFLCFTQTFCVVVARIQNLRFHGTLQIGVIANCSLYFLQWPEMHLMLNFLYLFYTVLPSTLLVGSHYIVTRNRKSGNTDCRNRNLCVMLKFTERPKSPGMTSKKTLLSLREISSLLVILC